MSLYNPLTWQPPQDVKIEASFEAYLKSPAVNARTKSGAEDRLIARIKREAYNEGRAAGYKDGYDTGLLEGGELGEKNARREMAEQLAEQVAREISELRALFQRKVDALNAALPAFFADAEEAMADRATDVVSRLLSSELATSRESVLAIVRETLGEITMAKHARIVVNPIDHPLLEKYRAEITRMVASLRDIEIVDDPSILGGCRVETSTGDLDATTNVRLAAFEQAYREAA